jgi:uncharacterized protein
MKAQNFRLLAVLMAILCVAAGLAAPAAQQTPSPAEITALRLKAEGGDAEAQLRLGFYHQAGMGVPKNSAKAVMLFYQAAERGNANAQNNLGVAFENGDGVGQDDAEAAKWYRKAAEQGHADAQRVLGAKYFHGKGVPKDEAEAIKWLLKAAHQGNAEAQQNLALIYASSSAVPQDDAEVVKWLRKAAEQGSVLAQHYLGARYASGQGVGKDATEAYKWWLRAAEQGHVNSQHNIGIMYEDGVGIPKDEAQARKWYRKAAEQGNVDSQYNLGLMYAKRQGVLADEAEALKWFRMAAEHGLADAQYYIGLRYSLGKGVLKDDTEAYKWWLLAGSQGHEASKKAYGELERLLTPSQRAEGQRLARDFKPREGALRSGDDLVQQETRAPAVSAATHSNSSIPTGSPQSSVGGIFMQGLGWCAFAFTLVMCLHFGAAIFDSNKPQVNREAYFKTAFALAVQVGWALAVPTFNKLHLLWMYWPTVHLVATLVTKWAIGGFSRSIGLPAPLPLPPLTTTLVLQFALLWLLS